MIRALDNRAITVTQVPTILQEWLPERRNGSDHAA